MALFGSKKKTEAAPAKATKAKVVKNTTALLKGDYSSVIIRPRITEKASLTAEKNVYAFEVTQGADKKMVTAAIKTIYNVVPRDVRFVRIPAKKVFVRGKWGMKVGGRKAYVVLNQGDKIEFV